MRGRLPNVRYLHSPHPPRYIICLQHTAAAAAASFDNPPPSPSRQVLLFPGQGRTAPSVSSAPLLLPAPLLTAAAAHEVAVVCLCVQAASAQVQVSTSSAPFRMRSSCTMRLMQRCSHCPTRRQSRCHTQYGTEARSAPAVSHSSRWSAHCISTVARSLTPCHLLFSIGRLSCERRRSPSRPY